MTRDRRRPKRPTCGFGLHKVHIFYWDTFLYIHKSCFSKELHFFYHAVVPEVQVLHP